MHSTYEDNMVDAHADDIAAGFGDAVANLTFKPREIQSPQAAAMAAMDLMIFAQKTLPPETLCRTYDEVRPGTHKSATKDTAVIEALWQNCGEATIEVIAAGAVTLGAIWQAAWRLSGAAKDAEWLTKAFNGPKELMPIYQNKEFLPSLHLPYLGQADLPGSDAPKNPPRPPSGTSHAGTHTDERGHSQTRSVGTPRKLSPPRASGPSTPRAKATKRAPRKR